MKAFYGDEAITPVVQQHLSKNNPEENQGKTIKNKYTFLLLFGSVFLIGYFSMRSGDTLTGIIILAFGGVVFLGVIIGYIRRIATEKTAQLMRGKVNTASATNLKEPVAEQLQATDIPEFKLEVYEQNELPDVAYTYNEQLTEEKNIFSINPLKIFYFFNFYSSDEWIKKIAGGWQRHGSLFHLGSPGDIAISNTWKFYEVKKTVNNILIASPEKLSEAIDNISYKPLPPKTKGLIADNYISGAYSTNSFLCTDTIWQQCVELLFNKTDFSLIDAADYTTERAGLQWEIHRVIDHVATENFIVLINGNTDFIALAEAFRNTWKQMSIASPNNRAFSNPIRFVFYQEPDRSMGAAERNNPILEAYRQQALSNDRIISFALQSKKA
jgi:hypothetical protein